MLGKDDPKVTLGPEKLFINIELFVPALPEAVAVIKTVWPNTLLFNSEMFIVAVLGVFPVLDDPAISLNGEFEIIVLPLGKEEPSNV